MLPLCSPCCRAAVPRSRSRSQGDGTGEHPTQALLDVYTMQSELGRLRGLRLTAIGDLKNGRTVHSLVQIAAMYGMRVNLVSPESLAMPAHVLDAAKARGDGWTDWGAYNTLDGVLEKTDVLYVTRVQKERFSSQADYDKVKVCVALAPRPACSAAWEGTPAPRAVRTHLAPLCPSLSRQPKAHASPPPSCACTTTRWPRFRRMPSSSRQARSPRLRPRGS